MNAPIRRPLLEQGSPEWHTHRVAFRNASEAGAVVGANPWLPRTPRQLALVKSGKLAIHENAAMRRGTAYEAEARLAVEEVLGLEFSPAVFTRGPYSASLDGISFDGETVLELKVPARGAASETWKTVEAGGLPAHYAAQVAQQWYCSGAKRVVFAVYCPVTRLVEALSLSEDYLAEVWASVEAAWERYAAAVDAGLLPDPMEGDVIESDSREALTAAEELLSIRRDIKALEAREKELEAALKAAAPEGVVTLFSTPAGALRATWVERAGNVDYAKIPELKGIDLEPYRKRPTVYLKLSEETRS